MYALRLALVAGLGVALPATVACTDDGSADDGAPSCVDYDHTSCELLYPATYDQVWSQTVESTCSGGGAACHEGDVGLTFTDPATTHASLLSEALVVPGDPACSPLMVRLLSDDPSLRMPPGQTPIADGAICSIATWIADGAEP